MEAKVSIVVVSFNTREKLRRCLACIEPEFELIVVDNASQDGSPAMVSEEFPSIKLILNSSNLGFGAANNLGCSVATGDLVLFLNSDAYADAGAIRTLAAVFDAPDVVGAGGMLLNPDRSLQQSTSNRLNLWSVFCEQTYLEKAFPNSRLFSPYWTSTRLAQSNQPSPTPQVMGASLMVRANDGMPIGVFDERYFLYCEDTDLCKRLESHGKLMYVPQATFIHDLGSSSSRDPTMGVIRYNRGKELYFRIHHGFLASWICFVFNRLGAALRLLAWAARLLFSGFRSVRAKLQVNAFWRVLTAKPKS